MQTTKDCFVRLSDLKKPMEKNPFNQNIGDVSAYLRYLKYNTPLVDAVEVVRCKDCVYFMEYTPEYAAKVEHADGDCRIRLMRSDDPEFNRVLKNEFCSFGRKEVKKP